MEERPPICVAEPACLSSQPCSSSKRFWRLARVVFLGSMAAGFVMTLGMTTVLESVLESVIDSRVYELQAASGAQEDLRSTQHEGEPSRLKQEVAKLRFELLRSETEKRRLEMERGSCVRTWVLSHASAQGVTTQVLTIPRPTEEAPSGAPKQAASTSEPAKH